MRKIERVKRFIYRSILKCKTCGRQEMFYAFVKPMWPTHGLNGWYLHKTEKCASCMFIQMVKDGKVKSKRIEAFLALGMNEREIRSGVKRKRRKFNNKQK